MRCFGVRSLFADFVLCLIFSFNFAAAAGNSGSSILDEDRSVQREWKTLSGSRPLVIARGGLSGVFPDSTNNAYLLSLNNSLSDVVEFCDVQLTKDAQTLCRTNLDLSNSTNIGDVYPNRKNTYVVNGKEMSGYFALDFTSDEIHEYVAAIQAVQSRSPLFDNALRLQSIEGMEELQPPVIWLNVEYSKFYEDHKLSTVSIIVSAAKSAVVSYISSPEVQFLLKLKTSLRKSKAKLIFKFLEQDAAEPTTNKTYGEFLKDLTSVKNFASGILIPKSYIWPLNDALYLETATTVVQDAHKAGLEVYASGFANDEYGMSYNYSYDPIKEYLQFMDNGNFAVDGFLTDFSVTASEAIACYAHNRVNNSSTSGNPLIISNNGASGDFPGCTDLAYQKAVSDGADYIDCSVQMTKDGIAICRESPDLLISTNVASNSEFYPGRMESVKEIQKEKGIFTFSLTWKEIQRLLPQIFSPYASQALLYRNPAYKNAGKFMTLQDFLAFAKGYKNISVLVDVKNARYLAEKQGLDLTGTVISDLKKSAYENMTGKVLIQSDDSGVLDKFKNQTQYQRVYYVDATYATLPDSTIKEIKEFADGVTLSRPAIILLELNVLIKRLSDVVQRMHKQNLSVFAYHFRNEFMSLPYDFQADPTLEINTYVKVAKVDGFFTDFPATARAYFNNACRRTSQDDYSMFLVNPGDLLATVPPVNAQAAPPTPPSSPVTDVLEPPLPPVSSTANLTAPAPAPARANATSPKNDQPKILCHIAVHLLLAFVNAYILLS